MEGKEVFLLSNLSCPSDSSALSIPCCVFHQKNDAINKDARRPTIVSYASFGRCLNLHTEWLRNTIASVTNGHVPADSIDDIVIAYISGNTPDALMSVLACTSPTLKPAIPALLNTRWTNSEMIASLRSAQDNSNTTISKRKVFTIVLHDGNSSLENMARQVADGLKYSHNHCTCSLPIPLFSQEFLEMYKDVSLSPDLGNNRKGFQDRMRNFHDNASQSDALILFTSGTTGGAKGVRLSHRALLVQSLAKLGDACGYSEATAMLATTVPLFHVGGLSSFLAILLARGMLIFPRKEEGGSNSFQVEDMPRSLQDAYIPTNTLVVVPAMLASFFASNSTKRRKQYPKTRFILIGGQSASKGMLEKVRSTFPNARIAQTYACTEAASSMTFLSLTKDVPDTVIGSPKLSGDCVGKPPNHIRLWLFKRNPPISANDKPERITQPYEIGLIATYGPHVMNGYWKRGEQQRVPKSTISKSNPNRFFISTDLGFWDDQGRLCFGGRAKDVVRTGGETVLTQEVEKVLLQHPSVTECAVFPRKDDRYGEAVASAIVASLTSNDNDGLGLKAIKSWCQEKGLAGYKQPKFVFLVEALPRNSSGKILKHKLVAQFGNQTIRSKI